MTAHPHRGSQGRGGAPGLGAGSAAELATSTRSSSCATARRARRASRSAMMQSAGRRRVPGRSSPSPPRAATTCTTSSRRATPPARCWPRRQPPDAPNIVSLILAAPETSGRGDATPPDDENPLPTPPPGDEARDDGRHRVHQSSRRKKTLLLRGGGRLGRRLHQRRRDRGQPPGVTCCLAVAPFHILPEVGFRLIPQLTLSLVGRIGFPLGADVSRRGDARAGGLRAHHQLVRQGGRRLPARRSRRRLHPPHHQAPQHRDRARIDGRPPTPRRPGRCSSAGAPAG